MDPLLPLTIHLALICPLVSNKGIFESEKSCTGWVSSTCSGHLAESGAAQMSYTAVVFVVLVVVAHKTLQKHIEIARPRR